MSVRSRTRRPQKPDLATDGGAPSTHVEGVTAGGNVIVAVQGAGSTINLPPGPPPLPLQKPLRTQHFTGRQAELAKLLADLQPGKMVTLCGPGGMGKSAVAAEAIWTLSPGDQPPDRFPDGIIFHTFYHQPQANLALEKIARAMASIPAEPADAALQALAGTTALLVLDGTEQADDLPAVLAVAGNCGVLVTTRRHADAPDAVQDVTPLPRPESLELLRAWAGRYAVEDAAANDIVRLLGGLPLALYLWVATWHSGTSRRGSTSPGSSRRGWRRCTLASGPRQVSPAAAAQPGAGERAGAGGVWRSRHSGVGAVWGGRYRCGLRHQDWCCQPCAG